MVAVGRMSREAVAVRKMWWEMVAVGRMSLMVNEICNVLAPKMVGGVLLSGW